MYKIALIYGDSILYWHSVVIALAVLSGLHIFLAVYLRKTGDFSGGMLVCPFAVLLCVVLGRFFHWYFMPDSYSSFYTAMTDFSAGSFALIGGFAGSGLALLVLMALGAVKKPACALDAMSIAGAAAIALGRLSNCFTPNDRGDIMQGWGLPVAFPVVDMLSGAVEYRFATFMFQSLVAGVLFVVLLVYYVRKGNTERYRDGSTAMLFLLVYCASQILLDSTRYDSLHLRSNGFVGAVQLICAVVLLIITAMNLFRAFQGHGIQLGLCGGLAVALMGLIGFMEYFVQTRGNQSVFGYMVMALCLVLLVLMNLAAFAKRQTGGGGRADHG